MAINAGPKIVEDGLILCLDAANKKSYPGAGTTWTDLSNTNTSATLTNNPTFDSDNGGSILFDGANDYVGINPDPYSITGDITLESWVRVNTYTDRGTLITDVNSYYMQVHTDATVQIYTYPFAGGSVYDSSSGTISLDTWSHIIFSQDLSGYRRIYINGELDTITPFRHIGIRDSTGPITIGGETSSRRLSGNIAIAKIYNRALSSSEVLQNYNATKWRFQ